MLKINTANAIKTSSEIKSYRSIRHSVGAPQGSLDSGRIGMGTAKRLAKQGWKIWFQAGTQCRATKRLLGR
ncbi:MAG: hypothetical protein ACP5U1_07295 [Desulfomonilaceae bacterium]